MRRQTPPPVEQAHALLVKIVEQLKKFGCCSCTTALARAIWPPLYFSDKESVRDFFQNVRHVHSDEKRRLIQAAALTVIPADLVPDNFKIGKEESK